MKIQHFLLSIIFLLSQAANAQDFLWAKSINGEAIETGIAIVQDELDNVYTLGVFTGEADFDPNAGTTNLTAAGDFDIFLQKLDTEGNLIWVKQLGSPALEYASSITVDAADNIYISGYFTGTLDLDPNAGILEVTAEGEDYFIAKFNPEGDLIWGHAFGAEGTDIVTDIALDTAGNVVATGYFSDTVDFDPDDVSTATLISAGGTDCFVQKLTEDGEFIWANSLGNSGADEGQSIAADIIGNIYIFGTFVGIVDFDFGPAVELRTSTLPSSDLFILKVDTEGNYLWVDQIGNDNTEYAGSIALDTVGNVYTTGSFIGDVDFDPSLEEETLTSDGLENVFYSRLSTDGDFVWARTVVSSGSGRGNSNYTDDQGNIYFTGSFQATADFDPGAGVDEYLAVGSSDIFIQKLDSSGNSMFVYTFGNTDLDEGNAIHTNVEGCNIVVTGRFLETIDFDPGDDETELSSEGGWDGFIWKLACDGEEPPVEDPPYCVGTININNPTCFGFSDGSVTVNMSSTEGATIYEITDVSGALLNVDNSNTANTLGEGWYYFNVTDDSTCTFIDSVFLDDPDQITFDVNLFDVNCFGEASGMATIENLENLTGDPSAAAFFWTPNPGGENGIGEDTLMNAPAGEYLITVNDQNGCSVSETFEINEPPAIQLVEFDTEPAYCRLYGYQSGGGVVKAAGGGGVPDYDYLWTDLTTFETITNTTWGGRNPGQYEITITDANGCVLKDTITLDSLNPIADFTLTSPQFTSDYEGTAVVDVNFVNTSQNFTNPNDPVSDTTFRWDLGYGPFFNYSFFETFDTSYYVAGEYVVCLTAYNQNGCFDTKCESIIVYDPFIFVPVNVFTPNGDGNNDVFTFANYAQSVNEFNCEIVNRWGVKVATLNNINESWDGTDLNGQLVADGVYFYVYSGSGNNGDPFSGQGTVTLVKKN